MNKKRKEKSIVISSGYFNPIHKGHINHLKKSKELGDYLVVIVNNDQQVFLKKGYNFMPIEDRIEIVRNLGFVDEVFESIDEDRSVCKSIAAIANKYRGKKIIFAKGGDRNVGNIPEREICGIHNVEIIDGVGGQLQMSSKLMKNMEDYIVKVSKEKAKQTEKNSNKKVEITIAFSLLMLFFIILGLWIFT